MATYTVKKGDSLWSIASSKLGSGSRWREIATLNKISTSNPAIYPGQVLNLPTEASTTTKKAAKGKQAVIDYFGLQSGTDRTVFAAWDWDKSHTENYKVMWYYATGDGVWFVGNDGTSEYKQSTYSAPENATKVKFKVKPVSKTYTKNKKETTYWTAEWSTAKQYNFSDNPPGTPPVPTVEIDNLKLTASLENLDLNATKIKFQIVKDDKSSFKTITGNIKTTACSVTCTIDVGHEYKVRCKAIRGDLESEWSEYSGSYGTIPSAPSGWVSVKASSPTSVTLNWNNVKNCDSYELQYTNRKGWFDSNPSEVSSVTIESVVGHAELTGLESGEQYFFRVRAVNENGNSAWSVITSIIIGKKPSAPTTWSSTTTVTVGDILYLYWIHNTEDGSSQVKAELELNVDGIVQTKTITNSTAEDKKDKTSQYKIDTNAEQYNDGVTIKWRVRTCGITGDYGSWSIMRTVKVYAEPYTTVTIQNNTLEEVEVVTSYPFGVRINAGPSNSNQKVLSHHISITARNSYTTVDEVGVTKTVKKGDEVYSKQEYITDGSTGLLVYLKANDVDLQNNVSYEVTVVTSMNSGLTAKGVAYFSVGWEEQTVYPNAQVAIDTESLITLINPYCLDDNDAYPSDILLSVYRREYDGRFTEIETGITNKNSLFVVDPHPSLDYARYRIVAISTTTGAVDYYDLPAYPVGEAAVVIQWNEEWSSFDTTENAELEEQPFYGSMLKLPYNIDISDNNAPDVQLVEYIGRQHPVSYYGTHIGTKATWNVEIPKDDIDTLYALRRLAIWMGDVYVREPSGSGYWANITVTFSQKHCELTIPVTLNITRVEGGA